MKPITVWFNKSLSNLCNVLEIVRAAASPPFRLLATHTAADFAAFALSDAHEQEPRGLVGERYVEWCLDFVQRHQVDVFMPGKELRAIVRRRERFEQLGVRVVAAADADRLTLLESKAGLYQELQSASSVGQDSDPVIQPNDRIGILSHAKTIPAYALVRTLAEFDAACERLLAKYPAICFKPNVSVFGLGFRILTATGSPLERLLAGDVARIDRAEARRLFGERERFRDVMVMPYLPGPERSVDCLAHHGRLVRAVVRRKPMDGYAQLIEDNPPLIETCRELTERLLLCGVFNVQFRDLDGISYLLEINPRMSGGIHYACLSGVALPYWAIRLALGDVNEDDIPQPQTGGRVVHYERAVLL